MNTHALETGLCVVLAAAAGSTVASLLSCLPGFHIYNALALIAIAIHALGGHSVTVPPEILLPTVTGMIVGWAMNNAIPSILLGAPDESAIFTVLPGQTMLMKGRGWEAAMLTAVGGAGGAAALVLVAAPAAPFVLPTLRTVFQPHYHWILWCVIAFMLMSEWPKGGAAGQGGWRRFFDGWKSTGTGVLTFVLSGVLGFVLVYRSPIPPASAFQNLMPAFVGLFAIPWLLLNVASRAVIPAQCADRGPRVGAWGLFRGIAAGAAGGAFSAFFPGVTGGVGAMLAGHATAQRDERLFLISQGAAKLVYYAGAFLLFFVPGAAKTRGGGAWLLSGLYAPNGWTDYWILIGSIAVSAAVAFALAGPLAHGAIRFVRRYDYRHLSLFALALVILLVFVMTGINGLLVMSVATGIGLLPALFGSRRMNCLGIVLLPLACNMSGAGAGIAHWLGLL